MTATIRPLNNKIVVVMTGTDVTAVSNNVLYIPGQVKQNPCQGIVIAVGPGKRVKGKIVPSVIKPGDTVLFPKGTGQIYTVDKRQYLMMTEDSITGVITA